MSDQAILVDSPPGAAPETELVTLAAAYAFLVQRSESPRTAHAGGDDIEEVKTTARRWLLRVAGVTDVLIDAKMSSTKRLIGGR